MKISKFNILNFKSIKNAEIAFDDINVLIGANGVGKSNLISAFDMLNRIVEKRFQTFVAEEGGADNILHFGRKASSKCEMAIFFGTVNRYRSMFFPNNHDQLFFRKEGVGYKTDYGKWYDEEVSNQLETSIYDRNTQVSKYVTQHLKQVRVFHFHDTSKNSSIKQSQNVNDGHYLRSDASNLAAFLYQLELNHPSHFKQIEATIKSIAPFFDRFDLRPAAINKEKILLEWKEVNSDKYFNASQLSDGTLRMIALTTLLLQPNPPKTIIIDEPELGLHPAAIIKLAALIRRASHDAQIILSTQSITLINQFSPDQLIVTERKDGASTFRRLEGNELGGWLNDYSLGEIWEKNLIGGRP